MEAKHTPGPWHAEPEEPTEPMLGIAICAADAIVATIHPEESGPPLDETDWANAYAIAAAPDLLAALDLYVKLDNDRRAGCEITAADWAECHQAAMTAKAKGGA